MHSRTASRILAAVVLAVFLVGHFLNVAMAQPMALATRQMVIQTVVNVLPVDLEAQQFIGTSGSGTIITPAGEILTNYHVVQKPDGAPAQFSAILTVDPSAPDTEPAFTYYAEFVGGDPVTDLAVLRIVAAADGTALAPGTRFPHATYRTSETLFIGDPIFVAGFPGIAGNTITFTAGVVSGFLGEDTRGSGRNWIKTDARASPGNSGGGAFDVEGFLVAIPTALRTIDGVSQELLRPIDLALPLLKQHVPGLVEAGPIVAPPERPAPTSTPSVERATPSISAEASGILTTQSETFLPGRYIEPYTLDLVAFEAVRVQLRSADFDAYLIVVDSDGNVVLEVDDSIAAGTDVDETFTPVRSGTYVFAATTAYAGEVGGFDISVESFEAPGVVGGTIASSPQGATTGAAINEYKFPGTWSGTIEDSVAGRGVVVVTMTQIGPMLEGTWRATFSAGSTEGTLSGLLQSTGVYLELSPSDPEACPFFANASLISDTLEGAYEAFSCPIPIFGFLSISK